MNKLHTLTMAQLKKHASGLRSKIKAKGGANSTDSEVAKLSEELKAVKSVIADKEIAEAKEAMIKNSVLEALKNAKP